MSLLRTLQRQPRIISLFAYDLENCKPAGSIVQFLKSDTSNQFDLELCTRFPTLDQLLYMYKFKEPLSREILNNQIKNLNEILKLKSFDSIFGSTLEHCVKIGVWNPKHALWVDWEKAKLGSSVKSIKQSLNQ
ncbi:hypothetical protein KAFR_0G00740 [Kazachstania africana CBS 2517]|uniref:Uncharacterized protein n=1 Tax=Kazachstania africana (strain ATCC 22294 / BCRC 22015 / CBS 2517 / CECT 1963 / NBRC 1671 / NRRL Y-8276) TaxID=1071382 RepID=H2AXK7_KAZAF|nr:hypothetical protein KAFR_0G00740 [Kazachstania africana CBS 2517]CCF59107.1 hypothetical protein KAFR_0G00740 [Kazachstania africana CBS 2517]